MSLGNWRPDFVVVSHSRRKIAILELCRPSDVRLERLQAAYQGKLDTYRPLLTALRTHIDDGWNVQILPWVVGARGLIQRNSLCSALEFLEVPRYGWQEIIDNTVLAAVSALSFMNRVRFSCHTAGHVLGDFHLQASAATTDADCAPKRRAKRKSRAGTGDLATVLKSWRRMAATIRKR